MKFADWLRGVEGAAIAGVDKVFDTAKAAVSLIPITNVRNDLIQLLTDAQDDLHGWETLAGTTVGSIAADGIDDITTLLMNQASVLSAGSSLSQLSAAEKAMLQQTWIAIKAQGETLVAQIVAGIDPTKPSGS